MKPLYVVLIALATGLLGFLTGGGLGLIGGGTAGVVAGAMGGMCALVDAAKAEKLLDETQIEKLGMKIGENFRTQMQQDNFKLNITSSDADKLTVDGSSTTCNMFLGHVKMGLQQK